MTATRELAHANRAARPEHTTATLIANAEQQAAEFRLAAALSESKYGKTRVWQVKSECAAKHTRMASILRGDVVADADELERMAAGADSAAVWMDGLGADTSDAEQAEWWEYCALGERTLAETLRSLA